MKSFIKLSMAIIFLFAFSACSDDDHNDTLYEGNAGEHFAEPAIDRIPVHADNNPQQLEEVR